jgi:hypothetical protein
MVQRYQSKAAAAGGCAPAPATRRAQVLAGGSTAPQRRQAASARLRPAGALRRFAPWRPARLR